MTEENKKRKCAKPDCSTILSLYNKDKFCYVHQKKGYINRTQKSSTGAGSSAVNFLKTQLEYDGGLEESDLEDIIA